MIHKRQVLHALKVLTFALFLLGALKHANAQSKKPAPLPAAAPAAVAPGADKSDKVDIKDLENQYWAPKDTDFSVVQNRNYTKEKRFALTLQTGPVLNDKYNDGLIYQMSGNYYWNERMGLQIDYQRADLKNNDTVNYFLTRFGGAPDYARMTGYYGIGFNYVPIYAKMSVLNKHIIYFDLAITPLLGWTTYDQVRRGGVSGQGSFTYGFDISQYFFFSRHFALRFSVRDVWYNEKTVKYSTDGSGNEGDPRRSGTTSSFQMLLGLTYFF